ncbi:hypothetical protein CJ205_05590 [Dolosicoccus paucivorans]|uniref:Insertion element IS150 protein InsJ-like helix-turn-helix domain-containing protein n=1 Tax=Dolosicoccus paucivorans TaxID=84521 RepID=A0A2N6SMA8_9LACT|nr:helix-turn-helix domain-containing protein [Dolosicoccus paucivorans]PMC58208.1 hypothetical protein CJ205_05590 [Dolosicoccus paucivorans]
MKSIITEEMRYRQKVVEYAEKYDNNAKAARRYGTSRQNVQRWRKRYDKTWDSLRNKSRVLTVIQTNILKKNFN